MKKLLCLVLSLMMILSVAVVPTVAEATEPQIPDGATKMSDLVKPNVKIENIVSTLEIYYNELYTTKSAWYIADADDLRIFSAVVNAGTASIVDTSFQNKTIYLASDIDMTGVSDFKPIGYREGYTQDCSNYTRPRFKGIFDGQGFSIKNLKMESADGNVGLFGLIAAPVIIRDLVIDASCSFAYTGASSKVVAAGSLAAWACVDATAPASTINATTNTGTVVYALVDNVKNYASVTSTQYAGGLVGHISHYGSNNTIVFNNCVNEGVVSGDLGAGGIAHATVDQRYIDFNSCVSAGDVISKCGKAGGIYVEELMARNSKLVAINGCTVTANVQGVVADALYVTNFIDEAHIKVIGCDTSGATVSVGYDFKSVAKKDLSAVKSITEIGNGDKVFKISTPEELIYFSDYVNGLKGVNDITNILYGYTVYIANNIDMNGYAFTPIGSINGTTEKYFAGTFDGQGYTIDDLKISVNDTTTIDAVGLFGAVRGGVVKNVVLGNGCSFTYSGTRSVYVGSIVGKMYNFAFSNAERTALGVTITDYVYGTIANCFSAATVTSDFYAGGILGNGHAYGSNSQKWVGNAIRGCTNVGAVTAKVYAGGILGWTQRNLLLDNCRNAGTVTVSGSGDATGAGGILGYFQTADNVGASVFMDAHLKNCVNNGTVAGANHLGGIVAKKQHTTSIISGCVNYGELDPNNAATDENWLCAVGADKFDTTYSLNNVDKSNTTDTDWTSVKFVGVQTKKGTNGYDVRFLATVNDLTAVTTAGFQIEITYNGTTKVIDPMYASYAFDSVYFETENGKDTAYAGAYNGIYFVSAVITDIPNDANVVFNVKTIENGVTAAEGVNLTLNSGSSVA